MIKPRTYIAKPRFIAHNSINARSNSIKARYIYNWITRSWRIDWISARTSYFSFC